MSRILLIALEVGLIGWFIHHLLRRFGMREEPGTAVAFEKVQRLVARFGRNSNSFMILYPGFEYFESSDPALEGVIGYVNTTSAWVIGAEPLAAEENQIRLLDEFTRVATKFGKRVLMIPADQGFAERAVKIGFGAIVVGSEPVFLLSQYPKTGTSWLDAVPAARQFSAKGAIVREFKPSGLSEDQRAELDEMTAEWLGTRKTATLGFLNQVHPWLHAGSKKYFTVELDGKTLAFLAAIPIPTKNGWYLIDTIRRENSPSGTTELLLLEAMKKLREQGAEEITFGVAPLSGIEVAEKIPVARPERHRILYKTLALVFKNGNQFYNFKPLFAYKMKFQPTLVRPAFLLYRGSRPGAGLSMKDIVSLSQAWLPHGIAHATGLGLLKLVSRLSLPDLIKTLLRPGTIVRSVPPDGRRLLYRCRLSVALIALSIVTYFLTTSSQGLLLPRYQQVGPFVAPFLFASTSQLFFMLLGLVIFSGGLEYLAGSKFMAACYFVPMIVAVLLFKLVHPGQVIVGGGLGVFGCAGGLYWFLKRGWVWLPLLALVPGWGLGHWVAIVFGILVGKILLLT